MNARAMGHVLEYFPDAEGRYAGQWGTIWSEAAGRVLGEGLLDDAWLDASCKVSALVEEIRQRREELKYLAETALLLGAPVLQAHFRIENRLRLMLYTITHGMKVPEPEAETEQPYGAEND